MLLSINIISHNQKEQLQRCIESVLQQDLPFEHEIIISDDASTDGTWELAQEYASSYPKIHAFSCNSNDCHPLLTFERSGYNRSNAYLHSHGKYFCHIDADDFYRPGTDCLKRMVELLESHKECSICMQNDCGIMEGCSLDSGWHVHKPHTFKSGQVISAEEYFGNNIFSNNGAMMMRRNNNINPATVYHKWYDDTIITSHHLQFGSIVTLDQADWIYVHTQNSATNSLLDIDRTLLWSLDGTLHLSHFVRKFTRWYYNVHNVLSLRIAINIILSKQALSNNARQYCSQFSNIFLYRAASKVYLSKTDSFRLKLILLYIKFIVVFHLYCTPAVIVLDKLCGGRPYKPSI